MAKINNARFVVHGPFVVEKKKSETLHNKSWMIDEDKIAVFKANSTHKQFNEKKGCYVYAIKASKGSFPIYVGMSCSNILAEAFTCDKIKKVNKYLEDCSHAKILLYFVVMEEGSGNKNIEECESYLIDLAKNANPDLINQRKIKKWSIDGIRGESNLGKPTKSVCKFKKCFNIK